MACDRGSFGCPLLLLRDDAALHVPDLMFPEVGNILWKKVRRGDLTEEQARGIARLVVAAPLAVHPSAPLLEAAWRSPCAPDAPSTTASTYP